MVIFNPAPGNCFPTRNSYNDYGAALTDYRPAQNFDNPEATDLLATQFNTFKASVAADNSTAFQCYLKYNTSTQQLLQYQPCWHPTRTNLPIFSYTQTPHRFLSIQFPSEMIDIQGNQQVMFLRAAQSNLDITNMVFHSFGILASSTVQVVTPNLVKIYCNTLAHAAHFAPIVDLVVY